MRQDVELELELLENMQYKESRSSFTIEYFPDTITNPANLRLATFVTIPFSRLELSPCVHFTFL